MPEFDYDLFISHASEDKEGFVRELVEMLVERGLSVWFDEAELQVGDSLVHLIDDGLRRSRFGVVVLSRAFFAKQWPRAELDALASRELSGDGSVVALPIWLDVGRDEVAAYSPLLANKLALPSSEGVQAIADKLERRVRGGDLLATPQPTPRLEPTLLRGRLFPYTYSPYIQSEDHALTSRVAIAARVPTDPEPRLRPGTQQLFEDALAGSQLESFMQALTTHRGRPRSEHFWQLTNPTTTWVITAARPAAAIAGVGGFTAEARAAVTLKHQPSVIPLGWLILHLDVAVRPTDTGHSSASEPIPLSLDELFALIYVPLTAILEEIAPTVVPEISGEKNDVLAVGCLVMPHGDMFERYVAFGHYASRRISGSSGPFAIDWYPSSLDEIATPEARAAAVRERIEGLFVDGGYRGFERDLERLAPPALGPPAAT